MIGAIESGGIDFNFKDRVRGRLPVADTGGILPVQCHEEEEQDFQVWFDQEEFDRQHVYDLHREYPRVVKLRLPSYQQSKAG